MPRPIILSFAGHYLPGYKAGGPIRSIANMVDQLGDEFDFRIVAGDRDLGSGLIARRARRRRGLWRRGRPSGIGHSGWRRAASPSACRT